MKTYIWDNIIVWNLNTWKLFRYIRYKSLSGTISINLSKHYVVSCHGDYSVNINSIITGYKIKTFIGHTEIVISALLSP